MQRSIVEYFHVVDGPKGHSCGYCKSNDGAVSNGMWTHQLTCQDYQDLISRGWRRSGKYCYKPCMEITCCPAYCIRCEATNFKISKSQKGVAKKMIGFLLHGAKLKSEPQQGVASQRSTDSHSVTAGVGPDTTKPPCRKAKVVRKEIRERKLAAKQDSAVPPEKSSPVESKVQAETDLPSEEVPETMLATKQDVDSVSSEPVESKIQAETDLPSFLRVGKDGKKPLEMFLSLPASDKPPVHSLELQLVQSSPPSPQFQSSFKESFALYQKYQMAIHLDSREKCSEENFRGFLCDSPLIPMQGARGWPCDYGSYHQHYRLDGKLIAVGVIDILPYCVSSVYLFYNPDYSFLSLGVYSTLRELEMTRKLYLDEKALQFYYMGYYIHSCQKMRYKGQYFPSFLLCPQTYKFMAIETCLAKIDAAKYARLNDGESTPEVEGVADGCIVLYKRQLTRYGKVKARLSDSSIAMVREYVSLTGPLVSVRMALFIQ